MSKIAIYNTRGEAVGSFSPNEEVFDGSVNKAVLHQAVLGYQANIKGRCSASTKTRSEVSGGGKKPWRQKGTGRARAGSNRSPLWNGGGVIFGPRPKDRKQVIPKRIRKAALVYSINAKAKDNEIIILDNIKLSQPKTAHMQAIIDSLKVESSALLVADAKDENLSLASRNIPNLNLLDIESLNAYEVLRHSKVIFTKDAFEKLQGSLK